MITLRPYQEEIVKKVLWAKDLPGNDVVVAAQGSGKSLIIAEVAHRLGKPVLVICPNKEILEQDIEKMSHLMPREDIGVFSASMGEKNIKQITFGTIQSMYKVPELFAGFDVVIYDECFVAGTKIGRKNIENIVVGDYVDSYNHDTGKIEKKKVTRVIKNELKSQLYLTSCSDNHIISTGNHPVYVKGKGYMPVVNLNKGDIIYAKQTQPNQSTTLHGVWKSSGLKRLLPVLAIQENRERISQGLLIFSEGRLDFNSKKIPAGSLLRRTQDKNIHKIEVLKPPAPTRWWKWQTALKGTAETIDLAWKDLETRVQSSDWAKVATAHTPQDRHSQSNQESSHRGGRGESRLGQSAGGRPEEAGLLRECRVESVEIYQQGDSKKNGKNSDTTTYVYNLEVEDNHNYFANGLLVHNCDLHNPKNLDGMSTTLFKQAGIKKVFGFTGTPFRQDTFYQYPDNYKGLIWQKAQIKVVTTTKMINRYKSMFWTRMLCVINTQELLDLGYLSPIEYHDVKLVEHEELKTNKSQSDFDLEDFEEKIREKYQGIANYIVKLPHKAKLVFCATIQQAKDLQSLIEGSVVVTSETTKKARAKAVEDLKAGRISVVFNVGIFTVGFDYPELDAIAILRPCRSARLHLQILGRVARIAPGKKSGHVYDFVSNVKNMGTLESAKIEKIDGKWNLTTSAYPQGMHMVPLYQWRLKNPK